MDRMQNETDYKKKYNKDHYERVPIYLLPERKEELQLAAEECDTSMSKFIQHCVNQELVRLYGEKLSEFYARVQARKNASEAELIGLGKFISLILRHKPETIGIRLDEHGWADVRELVDGIKSTGDYPDFNRKVLERIVAKDPKQRYSFNEDKTLIRANYGHSVEVDVELEVCTPPDVLYHGTGEKYVTAIRRQGLISKSRLHVHLSTDSDTAYQVGRRHGESVIFAVDARQMVRDGYEFYRSVNDVWLTNFVPAKYLREVSS